MGIVQLPDGGQAVLHDKMTVAGRRVLAPAFTDMIAALAGSGVNLRDFAKLDLSEHEMATLILGGSDGAFVAKSMDFQAAAIVAFVKEWTYGPNPTMDTVLGFTDDTAVFDALASAVAPLAIKAMQPAQFGPDGASNPASPTVPSSVSNDGGRAQPTPSTLLTETPPSEPASTATGVSFT